MKKWLLLALLSPLVLSAQIVQDVNRDNYVNCGDVSAIYSYLLDGDMTFAATCDVNGDGDITAYDITCIYNHMLGHDASNDRRMSFLHISDTHSVDVTLRPALEILNSDPTYSFMILTGDFLPTELMMQEVLASEKPVFIIPGNHDSWDVGTTANALGQRGFREQVLDRLYPNGEVNFGEDSISNYFYADVTQNGCTIRVIGLDLYEIETVGNFMKNSVIFSQKQIDWLIGVLEDSGDKDGVIILTHNGFGNARSNPRDDDYINEFVSITAYTFPDTYNYFGLGDADLVPSIVEAYMTGENLSDTTFYGGYQLQKINVTTNFDGPHNNFIAHFGGHIHFDVVEYLSWHPHQLMSIIAYGGRGNGGRDYNDLIKTDTGEDSYTINANNINFTTHEHQIVRIGSKRKVDGTLREQILFNF
ncbi:MAG: metallophosphoesterase [Muribaculaceae bacterium]|nr:metallophosphoesterase [Muribaculaceae bacterium]